jgi:hypothetical protein
LNYEIAVTPDGDGYAQGIVSTMFTVRVMEGRTPNWRPETRWREETKWRDEPVDLLKVDGYSWDNTPVYPGVPSWQAIGPGGDSLYFDRNSGWHLVKVVYGVTEYFLVHPHHLQGVLALIDASGNPLPATAEITIDAGTSVSDPYTLTYRGATYTINPSDTNQQTGVVMVSSPQTISIPELIYLPELIAILEHYDELAATLTTVDTTTVSGGITQFVKEFQYQSGIDCEGC